MQIPSFYSLFQLAILVIGCGCLPQTVFAQVVPDNTLDTQVEQNENISEITGGQTRGNNLFHSFEEFSIPSGGEVFFNNAPDLVNIFSRVTGGNISNINGLIRANGDTNLFLINPNGIIFGENASLDLGGSFLSSTADSIVFAEGEFSAIATDSPPLLTINAPVGLNLGNNPGAIVNRSTAEEGEGIITGLSVAAGNNLSFIGGDILFEGGNASARGGRIELGGLSEAGTVDIAEDDSFSFPDNTPKANVAFSDGAIANVRGANNGNIVINAQNLDLTDNSLLEAGIAANSTLDDARAGNIEIDLTNRLTIDSESIINNIVGLRALGDAGDINIAADSMVISNRGFISAGTRGQGNAGNISIDTTEDIVLEDPTGDSFVSNITSRVEAEAMGDAGDINLNAKNLILTGGGIDVISAGKGNAGDINLTITQDVVIDALGFENGILSIVDFDATGDAGNINISSSDLTLTNGGNISTDTRGMGNAGAIAITAAENISLSNGSKIISDTSGQGNAGNINITAAESIGIDGLNSKVTSLVSPQGIGDGGNLSLTANNLSIANSGFVSASTSGRGDAGNIGVTTNSMVITNKAFISAGTSGQGNAGKIDINTTEDIVLEDPTGDSFVSNITSRVEAEAMGDAGDINLNAKNLILTGGGIDVISAGKGNAGDINLTITQDVVIDALGFENGILSIVDFDATGDAGNINISSSDLTLTNGGNISTDTRGMGNAGAIAITASEDMRLRNGSYIISDTSGQGNAGFVNITANDIVFTGETSTGIPNSVSSRVNPGAEGNGGNIRILADSFTLTDGGQVDVSTLGRGDAGNINIEANFLSLRDRASINAVTQSQITNSNLTNANIVLQIAENITLDSNSLISAQAFDNASGGNINIDAGFIIAIPNSDSDIVADAEQGQGGNIDINVNSLFGIEERPLSGLTNDINASSEFGLSGTVEIDILEVNPSQDALEIPVIPVETDVARLCDLNNNRNGLVVTGRGGLPDNPETNLSGSFTIEDWRITDSVADSSESNERSPETSDKELTLTKPIVEANSWQVNSQGKVVLIAGDRRKKLDFNQVDCERSTTSNQ